MRMKDVDSKRPDYGCGLKCDARKAPPDRVATGI
jgi:hypothetical protein